MDDLHLQMLVARIEESFPDDLPAQRRAWEFVEQVLMAWDQAAAGAAEQATDTAPSADASADARSSLLDACTRVLRESGGRLATAVAVLLPQERAFRTLTRGASGEVIELDAEVADTVGVEPAVAVEHGDGYVTLSVRLRDRAVPGRLAAIVHTAEDDMAIARFDVIEPKVAAVHFDPLTTSGPIGVVVVAFDDDT